MPFEKEYIRKDGSRVPVLAARAMFDEVYGDGVAFVLDVTERKQAEERQKLLIDELNHGVQERAGYYGESGERRHAATRLARNSSSHAATFRFIRSKSLPRGSRMRLCAMCLECNKIGGRVIFADTAFVVAEDHVEHPMQAIFTARWLRITGPTKCAASTREVVSESVSPPRFLPDFTRALDHYDAFQSWPIVAFLQPVDIVDYCINSASRCGHDRHQQFHRG